MLRNTLMTLLLLSSVPAHAQMSMWGTGVYGGMQSCPYNVRVAHGAVSVDDETKEIQNEISEIQKQLKEKKSEKKKIDREAERAKTAVTRSLSEGHAEFIFEHIENSRRCQEYQGYKNANSEASIQGQQGAQPIANANLIPVRSPFTSEEWSQYCDTGKPGSVSSTVCTNLRYGASDGRADANSCKKSLLDYRKLHSQSQQIHREIERLEETLASTKENLKDAKKEALENQRERRQAGTEGDVCIECMAQGSGYTYQKPQTDWNSAIGNLVLGVGSTYMNYKTNQTIAESNANIGWPTNPYNALGYGYGMGAMATGLSQVLGGGSGIYGAMSGGIGSGAFGCAGNNGGAMGMMGPYGGSNGYGMWGNPYAMNGMSSLGGGIFNSGLGPWGMNAYGGINTGLGNIGNMMGMGNMNGYGNMMGGMTSYDPTQMQYQQQLMQLQMQQYQNYALQQQQKYSTMSSLQQEMYTLMMRMQQVQYGYGSTGYLGTTGTLGTTGYYSTYPTSSVITPLPTTSGTTLINSSR